jgi:hypothetical protein
VPILYRDLGSVNSDAYVASRLDGFTANAAASLRQAEPIAAPRNRHALVESDPLAIAASNIQSLGAASRVWPCGASAPRDRVE